MQIKEFLDSVCEQIKYKPIRKLETIANNIFTIYRKKDIIKSKLDEHNKKEIKNNILLTFESKLIILL